MHIVNKRNHTPTPSDVYVGRPSPLGNPFSHQAGTLARYRTETREQAIEAYRHWLWKEIKVRNPNVILTIAGIPEDANLVCWCAPLPCHAEVIQRAWNFLKTSGRAYVQGLS